MKNAKILIIVLFLLCVSACVETSYQAGATDTGSESPSTESPSPTPSTTPVIPSPNERPIFDPLNPEGWIAEDDYNVGICVHGVDDIIGDFIIYMSLEEAIPHFASKSYTLITEHYTEGRPLTFNIFKFDGIELSFWNINGNDEFNISSIDVINKEYATVRGLHVGDSANKVFELYGTPVIVYDSDDTLTPNAWFYSDGEGRENCAITVVDGVVERIRFWGFP